VNIKVLAFPDVIPCSLLYFRHQRFDATCCFFSFLLKMDLVCSWETLLTSRCHISGVGGVDDYH